MPRRRVLFRAAQLATAPLALAACRDNGRAHGGPSITGPVESSGVLEVVATPAAPTLTQRGLDLTLRMRDRSALKLTGVFVDPGTAQTRDFSPPPLRQYFADSASAAVFVDSPGRHDITLVARDVRGVSRTVTITRGFELPEVDYAVVPLPDLGTGSGARWVNRRGDVAGWVRTPAGRVRPAVWSGGEQYAVRVLALPDTFDVAALRVNTAGDVLLEGWPGLFGVSVGPRVLRADGTLFTIPTFFGQTMVPSDLDERRQALTSNLEVRFGHGSVRFDVAAGAVIDSPFDRLSRLNDVGQAAGTTPIDGYPASIGVITSGFRVPPMPDGPQVGVCDLVGRWTATTPTDLDDDANLLVDACGSAALLGTTVPSVWVDRLVGPGQTHLSRQGGVVASLDPGGSVFVWRLGTVRVSRVRLPNDAWRIDSLAAVNGAGAIAAQGVERATGRRAALLLTPVP
jgi:hypothetical protein